MIPPPRPPRRRHRWHAPASPRPQPSSQRRPTRLDSARPSSTVPFAHAQQPTDRHRFLGTFDAQQLRLSQHRPPRGQPRGGLTEHHPTRRSHRLGSAEPVRLAHQSRCNPKRLNRSHRQSPDRSSTRHVTGVRYCRGFGLRRKVDLVTSSWMSKAAQAGAKSVVLQGHRCAEHRHDSSPMEALPTMPPKRFTTAVVMLTSSAMISRSRSGTDRCRDVHRVHHVGEENRDLLVFRPGNAVFGLVSHNRDKTGRSLAAQCHTSGTLLWPSCDPPPIPGPSVSRVL